MKLIKRYTNRKLYDTERSCYVTLDEIAEMVREGEEVSIIDNRSGDDLTTVTLAQIVYEAEKKDKKLLPLQSLRLIIQSPSEFLARISKPVQEFRDETQQRVLGLRKKAEETQEEKFIQPVREFLEQVQKTIDELGSTLDQRLKDSVDALTHVPDLAEEVDSINNRLDTLEEQVASLQVLLEGMVEDGISDESNNAPPAS
ncbi:MAG: polyhydroxyalkanoate synthesis repressor PhaR [Bradymonadia bacterium]|jgi:polyhydroxyalkanoate synthesis repressor PhaR